jgi:hypothetical protein
MDNISKHLFATLTALSRAEAAMVANVRRRRYAVRLTSGIYASPNRHWTQDTAQAQVFDMITSANIYAVNELGLELDDFTVEVI